MATVEKRGDAWRVRWRDPDGKERSRKCPTARSAKELKAQVEESGRCWQPAAAVEVPSLVSLIDAWLQDLARINRAPRTIARAYAVAAPFLAWLRDRLGRDPLVSDLSRQVIEDYDRRHVLAGNGIQTRRVAGARPAGPGGDRGGAASRRTRRPRQAQRARFVRRLSIATVKAPEPPQSGQVISCPTP